MERNLLNENHRLSLIDKLQSIVSLPLPKKDLYLGNLNFLLYHKDSSKDNEYDFQLRWGSKSVFLCKQVLINDDKKIENDLTKKLNENKAEIRKEIIKYCISQLDGIILSELPIYIRQKMPSFFDYKVFVDLCRTRKKQNNIHWPPISVFVSWDDENGEFQEFVYPLKFDYDTGNFNIDYPSIVKELQKYRDTAI